jgi:Fe-S oxidoreductase/nitrate reductase gamma subunit
VSQPENRWDKVKIRLKHMLKVAFGQTKILRDRSAGPIHAIIFWGFLIFLFTASESVIQGFFPGFDYSFLGPVYSLITLLTDIFSILILIALILAFARRFIIKVPRLQMEGDEKLDAFIVLLAIFIITSSVLLMNISLEAQGNVSKWDLRPFASLLSGMFSYETATTVYNVCWWIHILAIYGFMNYLPFSKHLHVYTSIQNVFMSPLEIPNKLERIDFEDETLEKFGVSDIEDFKFKALHDSLTCTHCGRCDDACPANTTGKVLSPRNIIIDIRHRTFDKAPILLKQKKNPDVELTEEEQEILNKKFVGDYINKEALWQCTTCGACMQECPVTIEHVSHIVDMRRSEVMMEADFPPLLQTTFSNLENNGSPWAFSPAERADWADGLDVNIAANHPDFDILFWVGCSGSFDDRAKKVSVAFAKLMKIAGVNFAILGQEEMCNGDVARRSGNEYLADILVKQNIETFNKYNVKKIVTICPHCFNTFKNEYPDFGGNYEVIHHTDFLNDLIAQGKLKLKAETGGESKKIAYHDSCYLGRYNQKYEAPRQIIKSFGDAELKEAKKNRDKAFCCGAGGGQMFLEETAGKRVNIERSEQLLETGAKTIASNCPFCLTMLTDGLKVMDKIEEVEIKDIAELLLERVEQ